MKVYQIYFEEEQKGKLDYIPYFNNNCTLFFENSVIRELIEKGEHKDCDYFGVVSYQLRDKIHITKDSWRGIPNICNSSNQQFTPHLFESELYKFKPDAMSFQRHIPHDPITFANNFHPGFSILFKQIMKEIGYDWISTRFNNVFYCNYFVAKSEIYEKYVKEMLSPAMDIMVNMLPLMQNSKYPKTLPDHLKEKFLLDYYPYHPFICERMFSYFAHIHKLNCIHF